MFEGSERLYCFSHVVPATVNLYRKMLMQGAAFHSCPDLPSLLLLLASACPLSHMFMDNINMGSCK